MPRTSPSRFAALPLVALVAVLAGCGSGASTGASTGGDAPRPSSAGGDTPVAAAGAAAAPDPCRLVSPAEAAEALGVAFGPGMHGTAEDGPECSYVKELADPSVWIVETPWTTEAQLKSRIDKINAKFRYRKPTWTAVDGVGEFASHSAEVNELFVLARGHVFHVTVLGTPDQKASEIALAKIAVSHLG